MYNTAYFKDSRNMSEVDSNSITLIITSPPYFNIKDYAKDGYQKVKVGETIPGQIGDIQDYEGYQDALLEVWTECERVLEPNGKLCINVPLMPIPKQQFNSHYLRDIFDLNAGIENKILNNTNLYLMDVWIWNRSNPTKKLMFGSYPYPPNFYAQNTIEFIAVFVKDGPPKERSPEIKEASKLSETEWVEFTKQVWNIPIPNKSDIAYGEHPAIMPDEVARRLVKLFSFVEDIVLDPFLGSGTTASIAKELGRHWIGYEIDPRFEKLINKKLEMQYSMF
jgi:site-specific DNA-methyltransferase (cytosine-N4-specific)